ncbi:hypothetical protein AB0L10_35765 [Streptomyces flaveolus]|uniref:hypothetical protein n=1 Tax=Streptomyces flaveolus TaxID=67297 RepID=UPI003423C07B
MTVSVPGTAGSARPSYVRNASRAGEPRRLSGVRISSEKRPSPVPNGTSQASGV